MLNNSEVVALYFLYMTEFEINFDLILLYLNLLGLLFVIIIENINPSPKIPAIDM